MIWFSVLFLISCIDIFYMAIRSNSEFAKSTVQLSAITLSWAVHLSIYYFASRVENESVKTSHLMAKIFRNNSEVRGALFTPLLFPHFTMTLNGILPLNRSFILSFISSVVAFSVMAIQLNPPK